MKRFYFGLVNAFDLAGRDGRISFAKQMAILVLVAGTVGNLSTALGIALLATSYGYKGLLAFLCRKPDAGGE